MITLRDKPNKIVLDLGFYRDKTLNKYIEAERTHRSIAARIKKDGTNYAAMIIMQNMKQGLKFNWPCKLKFDWYLSDGKIDPDNWDFIKKYIFDGMQLAKYKDDVFLNNDSLKNISGYDHDFFKDKNKPRVEIYEVKK